MYLYEGHMGGFYTSEDEIDYDDLYCEQCGDSDSLIGWFDSKEELREWFEEFYECNEMYSTYSEEMQKYYTKEEFEQDLIERQKDVEKAVNDLWYED